MPQPKLTIIQGDALEELRKLPSDSVHCCVTSPGYWGLRSYLPQGHPDKHLEHGTEKTPDEWCARLVDVFREVRRVLHPSGVLFVNVGDAYARDANKGQHKPGDSGKHNYIIEDGGGRASVQMHFKSETQGSSDGFVGRADRAATRNGANGLKAKDLIGLPWLLAFALRADGWWLRQEIIWHKPGPIPESVEDRCTKAHEQIFLLAKSQSYFFDHIAIQEPSVKAGQVIHSYNTGAKDRMDVSETHDHRTRIGLANWNQPCPDSRNKRSVWTVSSEPFPGNHFATFPSALVRPMILAGTSAKGVCVKCLAPYERIVEREKGEPDSFNGSRFDVGKTGVSQQRCSDGERTVAVKTIGWAAGCTCEAEAVPAVVLDCFAGSFTSCAVALELGRNAIGIDLSEEYIKIGRERCAAVTPGLTLA